LDILDQTSMTPVQAPYRYGDVSKPSLSGWWLSPNTLKNMSQLGWWHSIPNCFWKVIIQSCSKSPTSYIWLGE
jgi:hypothetical protein